MPMQPRPRAETSNLLFPKVRFCISPPGNGSEFSLIKRSFYVVHDDSRDHTRPLATIRFVRKSDYEKVLHERYPDSANLLPISVDACIFVQSIANSALTWFWRSEASERVKTQGRGRRS